MLKKILEFIKKIIVFEESTSSEMEQVEEPILKPLEEEKTKEPITKQEETKQVVEKPKTTQKEVYTMLTNKQRQTYLKALGLYTKTIDNTRGTGQKKAEKQFNIIFLNKNSETYTEETDRLLRKIYASYKSSKYMVDTDWQYFKNFKKSEYKCKCKGKYCNGYPHKIAMHLVMADQYQRNYYGTSVSLTSGVRCKQHNKNVGGTSNSYHKKGRASDTITKNKSSATVRNMIYKNSSTKLPFVSYSYDITKDSMHKTVDL